MGADRVIEIDGRHAVTVELDEGAVLAKALRDVAAQIKDAMRTIRRMPLPREVSGMAETTASIYAAMAQTDEGESRRRRPPSSAAIDRCDTMFEYLIKVDDEAARNLLMVRGIGLTWERVIAELDLGCSISTVKRWHEDALVKMLCLMLDRDTKKA